MREKQEKKYEDLVDDFFEECLVDLRDLYDEINCSELTIKHWLLGLYSEVIINEKRIYLYYDCADSMFPDIDDRPMKKILEKRRYSLLSGKLKKTKYLSGNLELKEEFIDSYDYLKQKIEYKIEENDIKKEQLEVKIKQLKKGSY